MSALTQAQVAEAGLADWRLLFHALRARFRTSGFAEGLALVNAIAAVAEEMDHHPDLDLRWGHLDVRLWSHDVGGVTGRDVRLARRITELVAAAGARAVPEELSSLEIALDTPDTDAVRPFWAALLAMESPDGEELRDDDSDLPRLWFQASGAEEPRQRFHLDVMVPVDQAEARVRAVLEAGGRVVSDEHAPSYVVLEDVDGNRACVCTAAEPAG